MVHEGLNVFFKYREVNDYTFRLLKEQELYFSNPSNFNDPFDCKDSLIWRGNREKWHQFLYKFGMNDEVQRKNIIQNCVKKGILKDKKGDFLLDSRNKAYKDIKENLPFRQSDVRVYCFSKNKDNILMWSHYANGHKGICLCFKAEQKGNANFLVLDSNQYTLFPVNYQEDIPKQVNMLSNYKLEDLAAFALTKHFNWEYEDEYRLILWPEEFNGTFTKVFRKKDLEGIIFGLNTSIEDMISIHSLVKKEYLEEGHVVNFYKAREVPNKYAIDFIKIDDLSRYLKKHSE